MIISGLHQQFTLTVFKSIVFTAFPLLAHMTSYLPHQLVSNFPPLVFNRRPCSSGKLSY